MKLNKKIVLLFIVPITTFSSCELIRDTSAWDNYYSYYCSSWASGKSALPWGATCPNRFTFDGFWYELVPNDMNNGMRNSVAADLIGYVYNESTYEETHNPDETLIEAIDPDNNIMAFDCSIPLFKYDTYMFLFTIEDYNWDEFLMASFDPRGIEYSAVYYREDKRSILN